MLSDRAGSGRHAPGCSCHAPYHLSRMGSVRPSSSRSPSLIPARIEGADDQSMEWYLASAKAICVRYSALSGRLPSAARAAVPASRPPPAATKYVSPCSTYLADEPDQTCTSRLGIQGCSGDDRPIPQQTRVQVQDDRTRAHQVESDKRDAHQIVRVQRTQGEDDQGHARVQTMRLRAIQLAFCIRQTSEGRGQGEEGTCILTRSCDGDGGAHPSARQLELESTRNPLTVRDDGR